MAKKNDEKKGKKAVQTPARTTKRKTSDSPNKPPEAKKKTSGSSSSQSEKKVWKYMLQQHKWFPGKITTSMANGVIDNLKKYLSEAQRRILMGTCFAHFLECHDIVVQPQLIHYFLLRQVHSPNEDELWFYISGRFVRFSMVELCLVTGLRCTGNTDISTLENSHSMLKEKYFSQLNIVTHEDVSDAFISACQLPEQDVVELLVDEDVAKLGVLYFITSYLFPRDYKKVVDHYLFVVVEDFSVMDLFPWGKILFETTLNDMREGLSKSGFSTY